MGKLVVTEFITLDGVAEDPGGAEKSPLFAQTGPNRALRLREAKPTGECMTLVYERKDA